MAPVGYLSIDTEGNIIQINTTALQWLGLSYEDVIEKKKLFDLVRIDKEKFRR
ncbi:MAG: PAS domain S-box protein [Bacteroidetes bacterium]|nr:PAS domain S-box protein [Bacteroidota bacterium]